MYRFFIVTYVVVYNNSRWPKKNFTCSVSQLPIVLIKNSLLVNKAVELPLAFSIIVVDTSRLLYSQYQSVKVAILGSNYETFRETGVITSND